MKTVFSDPRAEAQDVTRACKRERARMADEQAATTRWCSSGRHHKPADQFASAKTCQTCAAKKEIGRRAGGQSKRRKGRATEGPPGTSWCHGGRKWCQTADFAAGNLTCNRCIQAASERKANARNTTAVAETASGTEGWDAETLVVHDSVPVLLPVQPQALSAIGEEDNAALGSDAKSLESAAAEGTQVDGPEAQADTPSDTDLGTYTQPAAADPLSVSYTPEGTEPVTDEVTSDVDDVTRMLGQQLRLEAAGLIEGANATGMLDGNYNTTESESHNVRYTFEFALADMFCFRLAICVLSVA